MIWRAILNAGRLGIKRQKAAALTATVLAALALLVLYTATPRLPHYVLVIDSGSTGTRIYAYTWLERVRQLPDIQPIPAAAAWSKVPRRQFEGQRAYQRVETEPGLDSYVNNPTGLVQQAVGPLLDWAEAIIPRRAWASTPVFMFATAGLRKLPVEHQESVLDTVRQILEASPFRFEPGWASVISGEREGIFGWIALNFLTGYLTPHPLTATRAASLETDADAALEELEEGRAILAADEGLRTVGALDLGGSSLEVTFVPHTPGPATVKANVSVLGVTYSLFTHAHHRYGLNDAFDRSVELLTDGFALGEGNRVVWEGHSTGSRATEKSGALADIEEVAERDADAGKQAHLLKSGIRRLAAEPLPRKEAVPTLYHPCLQAGYSKTHRLNVQSKQALPDSVQLIGRPDWKSCEALAALVVNASAACLQAPCALGAPQPLTKQPLYALTGFHVVYHFFGLEPDCTLDELETKGRRFCDTEWDAIAASRGADVHVDRYCFRVPYVINLLRHGLGMPSKQIRIGTGKEAWTLGAALSAGSKVGAGRGPKQKPIVWQLAALLGCSGWLLWAGFLCWALLSSSGACNAVERKPGGQASSSSLASASRVTPPPQATTGHARLTAPPWPDSVSGPPRAVVGGNFNSNIARLSAKPSQRKRVPSVDNLQSLH